MIWDEAQVRARLESSVRGKGGGVGVGFKKFLLNSTKEKPGKLEKKIEKNHKGSEGMDGFSSIQQKGGRKRSRKGGTGRAGRS